MSNYMIVNEVDKMDYWMEVIATTRSGTVYTVRQEGENLVAERRPQVEKEAVGAPDLYTQAAVGQRYTLENRTLEVGDRIMGTGSFGSVTSTLIRSLSVRIVSQEPGKPFKLVPL